MASLKGFLKGLARLPVVCLKGLWVQFLKDAPIFKFLFVAVLFISISTAIVKWTEMTVQIMIVLVLGISINKIWFLRFIQIISQSYDEEVIKAISKRIADWFEKFSIAALLPILVIALREEDFIKNSGSVVFNASLIALITFFCSVRITKHITEGLTKIFTRADLRDIIRESEYHHIKFDFDELPSSKVAEMIEEFNSLLHSGMKIDDVLRLILERQGLIQPAQPESDKAD